MSKKIWALILKTPALLLLIITFLVGIYAAINNIQNMSWDIPIILGSVIFLYFLGSLIESKDIKHIKQKEPEENVC